MPGRGKSPQPDFDRRRRVADLAESPEIRDIVASWGEPTEEQLRVLALLLRPGGGHRG